jgi:hypothetical protein
MFNFRSGLKVEWIDTDLPDNDLKVKKCPNAHSLKRPTDPVRS